MAALDHLLATLQIRVLTANRALLWPAWKVDAHVLPCNKIYFPYRGKGGFAIDDREFEIPLQHAALLPAKHHNRCWHDPRDPFEKIWIHFDARVLGLVDLFDVLPCPPPLPVERDPQLRSLLEALVAEFAAAAPYQGLALSGLLAQALAHLLRLAAAAPPDPLGRGASAQSPPVLRGPGDRIGTVLQFIAERFADELALEDLAAVIHLHPTYFSNSFRKATGLAPMAFLQRFRVERAKGLLASSDLPVMEVAARVGFQDPYHFSRVFKKLAGSPPKVFQESVRRTNGR